VSHRTALPTRNAVGEPVTGPVAEGLESEARANLTPAQQEPAVNNTHSRSRGRIAAGLLIAWVLTLGIIAGFGRRG
jgi:hypothetical protein